MPGTPPNARKVDIINQNDIIFEELGRLGPYHILLILTVWWCHFASALNETFMVFGGADVTITCPNDTANSSTNENCILSGEFYSIIEEWSLIGKQDYVAPLITSLQLAGTLFGTFLGGYLSDSFGRWLTLFSMVIARTACGIACSFMPNWKWFLVFRMLVGLWNGAYFSVSYIYIMEMVSVKYRLMLQAAGDCVMSLGFVWTALMAWALRTWALLGIVGNAVIAPSIVALLFLHETPRWLVQKGKIGKANQVANVIAHRNGRNGVNLFENPNPPANEHQDSVPSGPPLRMFFNKELAKYMLILALSFFVTGIVSYAIIFNTGNLSGSIFLNFAIMGLLNTIPTTFIMLGERFYGIRRQILHRVALGGVLVCFIVISTLLAINGKDRFSGLIRAASFIGSIFSVPLWTVCALYSAELFPTLVRNVANGLGNTGARLGGILAPLAVNWMIHFWPSIPFIVFGALSLFNLLCAWILLPETKGTILPDDLKPDSPPPTSVEYESINNLSE